MATITAAESFPLSTATAYDYEVKQVLWETMGNADTGTSVDMPHYSDKTVQIIGTFGGATVTVQGSNDGGTTWATLSDDQGTALAVTAATLALIAQNPRSIRVITSGGTGTDVDVYLIAKRGR